MVGRARSRGAAIAQILERREASVQLMLVLTNMMMTSWRHFYPTTRSERTDCRARDWSHAAMFISIRTNFDWRNGIGPAYDFRMAQSTSLASADSRGFAFDDVRRVLESTPQLLESLIRPLPAHLLDVTEGGDTWSPRQVVCHLAWGEVDDWIPRVRKILQDGASEAFKPFDRERGFTLYRDWTIEQVLAEFARLRARSLADIDEFTLGPEDFSRQGRHPEFGIVTLEQLLATWVTHDLAHVAQVSRVLTRHFGQFVGPWRSYFSLLR